MRSDLLRAGALALFCGALACGAKPVLSIDRDAGPEPPPPPPPVLPEVSIFSGADTLHVASPERCATSVPEALSLRWSRAEGQEGAGEERVFAAILRRPPQVTDRIQNQGDTVWWWSTGLQRTTGKGRDGLVEFTDGRGTGADGAPDAAAPADPARLARGQWHWFAVWAWDAQLKLVRASEARAFCPGGGCDCAEDSGSGGGVREQFCASLPGTPPVLPAGCLR